MGKVFSFTGTFVSKEPIFVFRSRKVLLTILIHVHHLKNSAIMRFMYKLWSRTNFWSLAPDLSDKIVVFRLRKVLHTILIHQNEHNEHTYMEVMNNICPEAIREGNTGKNCPPIFPDMKVDSAAIRISKIGFAPYGQGSNNFVATSSVHHNHHRKFGFWPWSRSES